MDNAQGAPEVCTDPAHRDARGRLRSTRQLVRDGFVGKQPRRRQRWRCRSASDPSDFHRFLPPVPRLEALERHCLDCESHLDVAQGPNAARRYDFVAREVAAALVALASGATYQQAALTARTTVAAQFARVGRPLPWKDTGMNHGQAAADWVEVFTNVVLAGDEDDRWPDVVLLDSTNFWRRRGGRQVPAFHVLMAYGYDVAEPVEDDPVPADDEDDDTGFDNPWASAPVAPAVTRGRLLRAEAVPRSTTSVWADFLRSWPGTPQVIVADRALEVRGAVDLAWPAGPWAVRPEFVNCRWHLAKNLREALVKDIAELDLGARSLAEKTKSAQRHSLVQDVDAAFFSAEAYREFRARVTQEVAYAQLRLRTEDGKLTGSCRWLRDNESAVTSQIQRRTLRPGPESTGPLEAELHNMRGLLTRRAQVLRNKPRTDLLLRLVVAGRRGQANERTWAEKVRQHLVALDGIPHQQRRLVEGRGHSSL